MAAPLHSYSFLIDTEKRNKKLETWKKVTVSCFKKKESLFSLNAFKCLSRHSLSVHDTKRS